MTVVGHVVVYTLALFGVVACLGQASGGLAVYRAKRHDAVMARIAKLEVKLGLGLDYAADWVREQGPDWVSGQNYSHIAVLRCRVCGVQFERHAEPLEVIHLCRKCRHQARG